MHVTNIISLFDLQSFNTDEAAFIVKKRMLVQFPLIGGKHHACLLKDF